MNAIAWSIDSMPFEASLLEASPIAVVRALTGVSRLDERLHRAESKFLKPVYAGDTLYPMLEVSDLAGGRSTGVVTLASTIHNQRDELVMEGLQKYLIRRRSPA